MLPHEYAFNAFLLLIALRVSVFAGPLDPHAIAFFGYFTVGALLIPWCNAHPTTRRWRARLLWYPIIMGISFFTLNQAVWLLGVPDADPMISRWEIALIGAPATTYFAPIESTWLTEVMMAAYLFFFYYLIFGPWHYWFADLRKLRNCFVGLFVLYALGFLGYSFFPAGGPHIDPTLAPLRGGPLTTLMLPVISVGSNSIDVFPSIHAAASLYLLLFDYANYRRRFWILLAPTIALWISTMYLRYHYAVDLLAGAAVTLVAITVEQAYERSALAAALDAQLTQSQ